MRLSKLAAACAALTLSTASLAVVVVSEDFDNVAGLGGAGWVQVNASPNPANAYFQGNPGVFEAAGGAANSYVAANYLSGFPSISNWLLTPVFTFASALDLGFMVRAAGEGFLDTVEVWLSASGASTSVGDFSTLVGSYSSDADEGWVAQHFSLLTNSGGSGRIGFRYFVADTNVAGNYIGIDSLTVSAVPEPASMALMGLGLAGLLAASRRRPV